MRRILSFIACAIMLAAFTSSAQAQSGSQPLTPQQAEAVKKLVRETLRENPELILEAVEILREKQQAEAEAERKEAESHRKQAIVENRKQLLEDQAAPIAGNPKGDVTVVEFFDYNCPYCKQVLPTLQNAIKADPKLKVVFKEYPILTQTSLTAAKAALAAHQQKKYMPFHEGLMKHKGPLEDADIFRIAKEVGLNVDRLKKDMESSAVSSALERNRKLGRALVIDGTPAFVIGDMVAPGAVDEDTLMQMIAEARKKG